jgi:hypothetical protein
MKLTGLNRIVVTVGISAIALVGLSVRSDAGPQDGQNQRQGREDQKQNKAKARSDQEQARQQQAQRTQAAVSQQQQRLVQYREHLDLQQRLAPPHAAQLQQQHRTALVVVQQQYVARLHQQQLQVQNGDRYNYGRDPFFRTAPTVRYYRGGAYYETNQYGANMLRQAVSLGYEEGIRVGMADRQDHWASSYEASYAYQDANLGFTGFYVDRDDYNAYFREGFRRGYDDGYGGRYQYGTYAHGHGTVLGAVLATILNFQAIR